MASKRDFPRITKPADQQQSENARRLQNEFSQALSEGRTGLVDRFGQHVQKGSFVLWEPPFTQVYEVLDVVNAGAVNPRIPVGTLRVVLAIQVPLHFTAGQRVMEMSRVGTRIADGKVQIDGPQVQIVDDGPDDDAGAGDGATEEHVDHEAGAIALEAERDSGNHEAARAGNAGATDDESVPGKAPG